MVVPLVGHVVEYRSGDAGFVRSVDTLTHPMVAVVMK